MRRATNSTIDSSGFNISDETSSLHDNLLHFKGKCPFCQMSMSILSVSSDRQFIKHTAAITHQQTSTKIAEHLC